MSLTFVMSLCLFFAFLFPGILAGEAAPVPDCGSFETVCCDGDHDETVPSIGAVVHGCSQCGFFSWTKYIHLLIQKKKKTFKECFHLVEQNLAEPSRVLFSSTLTDICGQLAK